MPIYSNTGSEYHWGSEIVSWAERAVIEPIYIEMFNYTVSVGGQAKNLR